MSVTFVGNVGTKTKGDTFSPNSCRGKMLLEHAFQFSEKIQDEKLLSCWVLPRCNLDLCWEKMTIVLFVLTRMAEKCRSKTKKLFLCLLIQKRLLIGYQQQLLVLLYGERVSQSIWQELCHCAKGVKLLFQLKGNYLTPFLLRLVFIKGQL